MRGIYDVVYRLVCRRLRHVKVKLPDYFNVQHVYTCKINLPPSLNAFSYTSFPLLSSPADSFPVFF